MLLFALAGAASTPPRMIQGFGTYEHRIGAPCPTVFSVFEDRAAWLSGIGDERLTQPPSAYRLVTSMDPGSARFDRTIERVPGRREVIAMLYEGGDAFADFALERDGVGCRVSMTITYSMMWPANVTTSAEAAAVERDATAQTMAKVVRDQQRLRQLAEGRARR